MDDTPPIMQDRPVYLADIRRIRIRRFKSGSMFKLMLIAVGTMWTPLFVVFGIAALFGAETVHFSNEPVTGIKGLLGALIMAPFFVGMLTLFAWAAAYIGVRIWGRFSPIELEYVPADR
jgi:hypothetical protein